MNVIATLIEVGGAIVHDLSYQLASSYSLPLGGVCVAASGFILGVAGLTRHTLIESVNSELTPDLETFIKVMSMLKEKERVSIRTYHLSNIETNNVSIIDIDRNWSSWKVSVRNDLRGLWDSVKVETCRDVYCQSPQSASVVRIPETLGPACQVAPATVQVSFQNPFAIMGINKTTESGTGIIVDKQLGLVLCDRFTVSSSVGNVFLTFSMSIMVPASIIYVHQIYSFVILKYEPKLLGMTHIEQLEICNEELKLNDSIYLVCQSQSRQPMVRKTYVANIANYSTGDLPYPPQYIPTNVESFALENPINSGGVIVDNDGKIRATYPRYPKFGRQTSNYHIGLPIRYISPILESIRSGKSTETYTLDVTLGYTQISKARSVGLTDEWAAKIEGASETHQCPVVINRVMSGSKTYELLKTGDIILTVNGSVVNKFEDIMNLTSERHLILVDVF